MTCAMAEKLMPKPSIANQLAKLFLQSVGISAILIALAGPQFGEQIEIITPKGSDLYVLLDVSRSMLANDVSPSRLARAKADINALVSSLTGERVGLIAFAGQAVVKVPLTVDYESFRRSLADIDTSSAPRGGTAIGDAIRKALEVFKPNSQRDQAILLITDGDDQKSAPLEAAEVAAERGVTIFSVGLGDSTQGARIPAKDRTSQFLEYEGEQVWSKLDGSLLEQLASKTSGVYIPAGTKNYDLREIYDNYLANRGGDSSETQTRIRRGEQYQWFLGIGVLLLLIDLFVKPYGALPKVGVDSSAYSKGSALFVKALWLATIIVMPIGSESFADDSATIEKGLRQYEQLDFEKASETFGQVGTSLRDAKSNEQHIAYFDQACAEHRLGNRNKAIELYLQAAMARDRSLAARANFNLARVHVDTAKDIWQDGSKILEKKEDREKLVDEAKQAIAAYRSSLELDPNATPSKKNIEIVRQWLKVVMDQWNEYDQNKRRNETDLLQFLDYMQSKQSEILSASTKLEDLYQLDQHAELKLLQDSVMEEFPFLNEKIQEAINPSEKDPQAKISDEEKKEVQKVLDLMLGWSDTSRDYMKTASASFERFRASESLEKQQLALDELDKIWNAVSPLEQTLQRAIAEQRKIVSSLVPFESDSTNEQVERKTIREQDRVLARAITLQPKAESMLAELSTADSADENAPQQAGGEITPEQKEEMKKFLKKAIELSPKAITEIRSAIESLNQNDGAKSLIHAKEAQRLLEEIKKEQPKQEDKQQDNQDQQNQDSPSDQEQNQSQDSKQQDQQNDKSEGDSSPESDDQKNSDKNQDKQRESPQSEKQTESDMDNKSGDDSEKNKEKEKSGGNDAKSANDKSAKDDNRPSQDRIAEALRKVREREAEKRDRDRQRRLKAYGQLSVDKDW
jgi:Ca-activated chloride channel family protein